MTLNYEQLEAEMQAGLRAPVRFVVSQSTLAHLVMASQIALALPLTVGSKKMFQTFIADAMRLGDFPKETRKLIKAHPTFKP